MWWHSSISGIAAKSSVRSVRGGARRLGDPREAEHAEADGRRVDDRGVAGDHAPRLELLDPLVGRRAAHADLRAELRVGPPAVPLEDLEDPRVGRTQSGLLPPSTRTSLGMSRAEVDTLGKLSMVVDHRTKRRTQRPRRPPQRRAPMIAIGFGFLALFSVLSILLGSEDPRRRGSSRRHSDLDALRRPLTNCPSLPHDAPGTVPGLRRLRPRLAHHSPAARRATASSAPAGRWASRHVTPAGPTTASWRGAGRQLEPVPARELDRLAAIDEPEPDRAATRRRSPCRSRGRGLRSGRPGRSTRRRASRPSARRRADVRRHRSRRDPDQRPDGERHDRGRRTDQRPGGRPRTARHDPSAGSRRRRRRTARQGSARSRRRTPSRPT